MKILTILRLMDSSLIKKINEKVDSRWVNLSNYIRGEMRGSRGRSTTTLK